MHLKKNNKYIILYVLFLLTWSISFSQNKNIKIDSASLYFNKALNYDSNNKHHLALENYKKAKSIFIIKKNSDSVAECNFQIYTLLKSQNDLKVNTTPYFNEFIKYVENSSDTIKRIKLYKQYAIKFFIKGENIDALNFYKKIIFLSKLINNTEIEANTYSNLGLLYTNYKKDSASFFFDKALNLYDNSMTTEIFSTYLNYGNLYQKKKDFYKSIKKFIEAEKITPKKYSLNLKRKLYFMMSQSYKEINNFKYAYNYLDKYDILRDSLDEINQNEKISDIIEKYDNEKLRADNLEIESKRKQNLLLLIVVSLLLALGSIIYILSYKNTKRKQKLAEQDKELETQKNLTLLKEQEITTINAMVDGQEKERKRIAEDLHDNLGSVLATLKLHFENLKINREKKKIDQETLFNKTENLIDEAYLKVRRIAHAKNAGVIANQGLLLAVQMMAEKISSADKINIEVIHYGLEKRLENTLELTIFRIVQELVTNVIKHADAQNATINISLYEKNLNIIVEDDGKGFHIEKIDLNNGMGISSIKTRIEHLKGTFSIDTTIGKGSSIILDIPTS